MLTLSASDKVFLGIQPLDFRKQLNGLMQATQNVIKQNPHSRAYFVFINRSKTAIKIFQYDGIGYWMHLKRLCRGKFKWPQSPEEAITMNPIELQVLLMNGDPQGASFQEEWQRVA